MNLRMCLFSGGVMLLTGIALWVYGYNVEPTAGEAIGNFFSGEFTEKRNAFMLAGLIVAAFGIAGVLCGTLRGTRTPKA